MHEEGWSRVDCFKVLDGFAVSPLLVACAHGTLVNHSFDQTDAKEAKVLNQWEEDVDQSRFSDEGSDVEVPLGGVVGVYAAEKITLLRA